MEYLESVSAGYLIKVKLKNLAGLLEGQKWETVEGDTGWEQADFQHQCAVWNRARRFVAVRKLSKIERGLFPIPEYEYFCYIMTEPLNQMGTRRAYGKRATCETWVEECDGQMNVGYVLTGGAVQQWEIKTMRLWLIHVAGKLTKGGRQLTLKLPEKFLHQEEWRAWEGIWLSVEFG